MFVLGFYLLFSFSVMEIEQNSNLEQGIDNKGFTDDKVPHLTNNEKENVSEKGG